MRKGRFVLIVLFIFFLFFRYMDCIIEKMLVINSYIKNQKNKLKINFRIVRYNTNKQEHNTLCIQHINYIIQNFRQSSVLYQKLYIYGQNLQLLWLRPNVQKGFSKYIHLKQEFIYVKKKNQISFSRLDKSLK